MVKGFVRVSIRVMVSDRFIVSVRVRSKVRAGARARAWVWVGARFRVTFRVSS